MAVIEAAAVIYRCRDETKLVEISPPLTALRVLHRFCTCVDRVEPQGLGTQGTGNTTCLIGEPAAVVERTGAEYLCVAFFKTAGNEFAVFKPKGEQIEQIPIDEVWTANVCFGGKDRKTLFVTAMDSLYSIKMSVKGAY